MVIWSHGSKSRRPLERDTWFLHRDVVCCYASWVQEYGVSAVNTWPIGNVLAYVNKQVILARNSNSFKTYCIGHSLGSHLCGFFGKMSKKLGNLTVDKIIGLDPAGPIWDYNDDLLRQDPNLRLNNDDALHVEVFHTNAKGVGFLYPLGDLDFYINGGNIQPMCKQFVNNSLDMHECCHSMAWQFYETLNKVDFPSCTAIWKCANSSESQLAAIENEIPSQLESQNCVKSPAVKVGDLDIKGQGVYWIGVDEKSKTCDYSGYIL